MEKITLASGIIMISLATFAFAQTKKIATEKVTVSKQVINANENISPEEIKDTVPETEQNNADKRTIVSTIDDKEYKLVEVDHKIISFYVDGKKIPADKMEDYRSIIDKMYEEEKLNQEKLELQQVDLKKQQELLMLQQYEFQKKANELQAMEQKTSATDNREVLNKKEEELNRQIDLLKLQEDKWKEKQNAYLNTQSNSRNENLMLQIQLQQKQLEAAELQLKKAQLNLEQMQLKNPKADFSEQNEMIKKKSAELAMQQENIELDELKLNQEALQLPQPNLQITPVPEVNALTEIMPPLPPVPLIKENETIISVINDLKNKNIISDDDNLSFTLNSKTFKVNGVVQPQSIQAAFKEKYIKHAKDHVIYSTSHGSTHADVNIND